MASIQRAQRYAREREKQERFDRAVVSARDRFNAAVISGDLPRGTGDDFARFVMAGLRAEGLRVVFEPREPRD